MQVDPAELSPGEFAFQIREAVERGAASRSSVIDSLNGYLNAMPEERFLTIQLHELLMYLAQQGVATLLIGAHHGMIGSQMHTPVDASYLADAVILLRYFEAQGRSAAGDLGGQETRRHARAHHPRVRHARGPDSASARRCANSAASSPACRSTKARTSRCSEPIGAAMTATSHDLRFLILAPTARDAEITSELLNGAGIETASFTDARRAGRRD